VAVAEIWVATAFFVFIYKTIISPPG